MTIRSLVIAAAFVLAAARPGLAQDTTTTTTSTTTSTGAFDALSPGNQKIATALFNAQNTSGTSLTPMTKDQIAALKGTEGWGKVFQQMKADGLVSAKNLGQVVSGHATAGTTATAAATTSSATRSRTARASAMRGHSTRMTSARLHGRTGFAGGRGFAAGPHAMGRGFAAGPMGGGFGHAGGFGGGFGGMGGGMGMGHGGGMGGGHGR